MTERPLLLDTCAALWLDKPHAFSDEAEAALQSAQTTGEPVYLSPITAWEVGMLVAKGKLALALPPMHWFSSLTGVGLSLAPLTPEILVQSSFLPGDLHGDPADRILAATARTFGYRLMTRDRPLLDYAAAGHLQAIAC